jgi:hypothetical protein
MHFWAFWWILIPLAAIFAGVVKRWLALQEARLDRVSSDAAHDSARQSAQVERLEQRVRVLERIVTDKGLDLADEIEKLRDQRVKQIPAEGSRFE